MNDVAHRNLTKRTFWLAGIGLGCTLLGASPDDATTTPPGPNAAIEAAIQQLSDEANQLNVLQNPTVRAHLTRPHPFLVGWDPQWGPDVLERMTQPILGNSYRDTYIRWHLMHVVKTINRSDRLAVGQHFVKLIKQMPGPVRVRLLPEWQDVPEDIANRYKALERKTHVLIGYPPWKTDYTGRTALEHVHGARREELEKIVEEMEILRPQWKREYDLQARRFNDRVRKVNLIVRQYRGELIYELMRTGDPKILDLVVEEIGRQVDQRQQIAFDLMSFMYMAAFDGELEHYDPKTLVGLSNRLKRIAKKAEGYVVYRLGDEDPPSYDHLRRRNFADYAFHMVHLLADTDVVSVTESGTSAEDVATRTENRDTDRDDRDSEQ